MPADMNGYKGDSYCHSTYESDSDLSEVCTTILATAACTF